MLDVSSYRLGESDEPLHPGTAREHRAVALAMAAQATRSLCIYTRDLDPAVYDGPEFTAAVSHLARRNKHAQVRILVQDVSRAVQEGHGLLRLAQQLSSKIQIRVPGPDHRDYNEAFFVADVCGFIRRPVADQYAAEANFKAPFEARKQVQYFDEVWESADTDPRVRRLFL